MRKNAGYFRFDTPAERAALAEVYRYLCPLYNYWYPSFRLIDKVKQFEAMRYQRMLESEDVSDEVKAELKKRAASYNPVTLKIAMDNMRNRLLRITREKAKVLNTSGQEVSARF